MIPLFDLHCDTLYELYLNNEFFDSCNLHISKDKAKNFAPYIQIFAIWSNSSLSNDDAYINFFNVLNHAKKNGFSFSSTPILRQNTSILSVEDARLLNGDIKRLDTLYSYGVKVLTLCWKDVSTIGGAWNTSVGLTSFGIDVIKRCFELGIIPDISHASIPSSENTIECAQEIKLPVIASHSNSYAICKHDRNLSDELFTKITKIGGLVGISLADEHISTNNASIKDILNHIYHFLSLGGDKTICLGCDFDGVSSLPSEISSINDLSKLFIEVEKSFGHDFAIKLFFKNAFKFFSKNL
jgi:membrane dipeptidase